MEDYHCVSDPAIHDAVAFLLKHAPSNFHLVIATRTEPPLPLPVLRAQNQLLEIDAAALRFDLEETRRFLEHEDLGPLDPAQLRLLHERTEGWPAVLRIVAATSSQSGQNFGQYVRQLSATLRPIGAYLAEMVDGLPRDMALFMLRTAVLDRFSADLCKAVTQHNVERGIPRIDSQPSITAGATRPRRALVPLSPLTVSISSPTTGSELGRTKLRPFTGARRTGTPRRSSGLKRSNTRSLPVIPSKRQAGSKTAQ